MGSLLELGVIFKKMFAILKTNVREIKNIHQFKKSSCIKKC